MKTSRTLMTCVAMSLISAGAAGAAAQANTGALNQAQIAAVKSGMKASLRDPDSAKFGRISGARNGKTVFTVCGWVNAKNGYGGYSGMLPFAGTLGTVGGLPIFAPIHGSSDPQVTLQLCMEENVPGF